MGWVSRILHEHRTGGHPILMKFARRGILLLCPGAFFKHAVRGAGGVDWGSARMGFSLSFDCDLRGDVEAIPSILDPLERAGVRADFACIGKWVEAFPEIHRELLRRGHGLLNHTYSHPSSVELGRRRRFNQLSLNEQREEIMKCHEVFRDLLGYEALGFRSPHLTPLRSVDGESTYVVLEELGYACSSSAMAAMSPGYGLPFRPEGLSVLEIPLSGSPRLPFYTLSTYEIRRAPRPLYMDEGDYVSLFRRLFLLSLEAGSYVNVYLDPVDVVGRPFFREMLDLIRSHGNVVRLMTCEEVAAFWGEKSC